MIFITPSVLIFITVHTCFTNLSKNLAAFRKWNSSNLQVVKQTMPKFEDKYVKV